VRIRDTVGPVLGNAYRILVAEDDNDFLAALAALLEADGRFAVAARASTGCEAVELARQLELDAIVMDIEMPVMDGVEATLQLQEEQPELPVVAVSGSEYEERVLEIRAAGAVDYVRKSRVGDDLVEALMAVLE
jgi:two-component system nitrate/nitrite response regulator NarL